MSHAHVLSPSKSVRFLRGARLGLLALVATPYVAVAGWTWQFLAGVLGGLGTGRVEPSSQVPGLVLGVLAASTAVAATVLALADRDSPTPELRVVVASLAGVAALLLVVTEASQVVSFIPLLAASPSTLPR